MGNNFLHNCIIMPLNIQILVVLKSISFTGFLTSHLIRWRQDSNLQPSSYQPDDRPITLLRLLVQVGNFLRFSTPYEEKRSVHGSMQTFEPQFAGGNFISRGSETECNYRNRCDSHSFCQLESKIRLVQDRLTSCGAYTLPIEALFKTSARTCTKQQFFHTNLAAYTAIGITTGTLQIDLTQPSHTRFSSSQFSL